jgi:hypothetical protein
MHHTSMDMTTRHQKLTVSDTLKLVRQFPGTVVLLSVELPEKFGFWFAPFSGQDLENWWRERDSFDFNPSGAKDAIAKFFGKTPPPHREFDVPGMFSYEGTWQLGRLWSRLRKLRRYYRGKICCDIDSYLERPDGSRLFHLGFRGDPNDPWL